MIIRKDIAAQLTSAKNFLRALSNQTDITYGCLRDGLVLRKFSEDSRDYPVIRTLYHQMINESNVLVDNLSDGLNKVLNSNYGLFVEKSFARSVVNNCALTYIDVKDYFYLKQYSMRYQYSIALSKYSNYTQKFNSAISEMKANGVLDSLRNRYSKPCGVLRGMTLNVIV